MKTHDRLGRWLFASHTQNPVSDFHPNQRQLRWMRFLNRHGLASSLYLHEATADTHKCAQTTQRSLRQLFDGGMIFKPVQQRQTEGADGNHHIYALSERGKAFLKKEGLGIDAHRPSGPWVHQFMVASITASIDILCRREGYTFIPGHEIAQELGVVIPYYWNGQRHESQLIPDALFAIRYGKGYIAYALEADRNTEPNDPKSAARKSFRRNIKQYKEFIGGKRYKKLYGLNCPLVVLNITVSQDHIERCLPIIEEEIGTCAYLAFGVAEEFRTPFKPPKNLMTYLFDEPLTRNFKSPFFIHKNSE